MAYHLHSPDSDLDFCSSVLSGVLFSDSLVCSSVPTIFPSSQDLPCTPLDPHGRGPRSCSRVGGMYSKAYLPLISWKSLKSPRSAIPNTIPTASESAITSIDYIPSSCYVGHVNFLPSYL